MSELTDFLLARIAEDEQCATAAGHGCGYVLHDHSAGWVEVALPEDHNCRPSYEMRQIRRWSPKRVKAECEAKRRIVEHCTEQAAKCPEDDWPADGDMSWAPLADNARHLLRLMTLPYADHPDYREEWRP